PRRARGGRGGRQRGRHRDRGQGRGAGGRRRPVGRGPPRHRDRHRRRRGRLERSGAGARLPGAGRPRWLAARAGGAARRGRGDRGLARAPGGWDGSVPGGTLVRGRPAPLLLAVGLDLVAGEPPDRWHPVAWIGRALDALERRVATRTVATGAAGVVAVAAGAAGGAALLAALARRLGPAGIRLGALALKPAFAVRRLATAAGEVREALDRGELDDARRLCGRHLVSRPTAVLDGPEVTSAAVESVAENLADSVAGPLLAYALGGLAGA